MNKKTETKYLFLITVIFIAACMETDIYLPAFPDMMAWFSASESAIQSLLTWNFVGICLSGPFYGPISDAIGRRKPLIFALGMFLAGSILTLCAQNFDQMLWGRILQGIGSGGCFTLGTAVIFDAFQKDRAVSALSKLNTIVPLIMASAPMLGGYLNYAFGFRSNFLAIAIFVLISFLICIFFLGETLPTDKRQPLLIKKTLADFKLALSSVPFWQLNIAMSLMFGAYIAFLSGTAVLFVVDFGMSKALFPIVQGSLLGGWVSGSLFLSRAINKWGELKVKKMGITSCVIGGLGLGLATLLAPRNPYLLTVGMAIYSFGANWINGLYFPEGMGIFPHIKGVVASLLTSMRLALAALVVGIASSFYNGTIYPLSILVCGTLFFIILPALYLYERRKAKAPVQLEIN